METLENKYLKVQTQSQGAQVVSVQDKKTGLEYIWQAGKEWKWHFPVLFPVVGQLKNDSYFFNKKKYALQRHGFARHLNFRPMRDYEYLVQYSISNQDHPKEAFPFPYRLFINYELRQRSLEVYYEISNTGESDMYFSIGAHPAFNLPLDSKSTYEDYYLEFERKEFVQRWKLKNGLLTNERELLLDNSNILPLRKDMFRNDAIILKNIVSDSVKLKSKKSRHGIAVDISAFPFLGIWSAPNADFICIEPWYGLADSADHNGDITKKEGILRLGPDDCRTFKWQIDFF